MRHLPVVERRAQHRTLFFAGPRDIIISTIKSKHVATCLILCYNANVSTINLNLGKLIC